MAEKKIKAVKENLLIEHSVDLVVGSSDTVTLNEDGSTTILNEDASSDKSKKEATFLKLTGVVQKGNYPNGNKRIYKTELLVREVAKFQTKITRGLAIGKVYHPGFFDPGGPSGVVDVSHRLLKLWTEGDIVYGELLIFRTASGKDIEAINDGGGRIGISSRGYGTMKRFDNVKIKGVEYKDVWVVDDNYQLETFDLVLTPSVKTAIMKPVKQEGKGENVDKVEKCNEDTFKEEGGKNPMSIEELKSLHPALYNQVRDAATVEGKTLGISVATEESKKEYKIAVEARDGEIVTLKEANTTLTKDNVDLKKENDALKVANEKAVEDKLSSDIKVAVTGAVEKSDYKKYYKTEDINSIVTMSKSVEDATKEVAARDKVYENTIKTFKESSTISTTGASADTSEDGSAEVVDKEKVVKEHRESQRALAFA